MYIEYRVEYSMYVCTLGMYIGIYYPRPAFEREIKRVGVEEADVKSYIHTYISISTATRIGTLYSTHTPLTILPLLLLLLLLLLLAILFEYSQTLL